MSPQESSTIENLPLQFFGLEKLPKEILPLILGRLSLEDLIMLKCVSRRFNILCKNIIDIAENNARRQVNDAWIVAHYFGRADFNLRNICIYMKLDDVCTYSEIGRDVIDIMARKILKFAKYSYEEYIWLYVVANYKRYQVSCLMREWLIRYAIKFNINLEKKMIYFRWYCECEDSTKLKQQLLDDIIKQTKWTCRNANLFRELEDMIKN